MWQLRFTPPIFQASEISWLPSRRGRKRETLLDSLVTLSNSSLPSCPEWRRRRNLSAFPGIITRCSSLSLPSGPPRSGCLPYREDGREGRKGAFRDYFSPVHWPTLLLPSLIKTHPTCFISCIGAVVPPTRRVPKTTFGLL